MIPSSHLRALRKLYETLSDASINWAVVGSLGLALQGVAVEVHDIDIATDAAGAYEIERRLSECVARPVALAATDKLRSHFGALELEGVKVEIMGDVQHRADNGTWLEPVGLRHKTFVEVEGMRVPVLSLEYEQWAYARLGRLDKARAIQEWTFEANFGYNRY